MLFDTYICVDWSAAATPKTGKDSIWIGVLRAQSNRRPSYTYHNPPTRTEARHLLVEIIRAEITQSRRVLVGFDFALGYPFGTADALGLDSVAQAPWLAMQAYLSAHIQDAANNKNNRFVIAAQMNETLTGRAHPFWGVPVTRATPYLSTRKGDFHHAASLPETRLTESWIKARFKAQPKSVWQLLGVGAVGSQALMGIPTVNALRQNIPNSQVWPFELGLRPLTEDRLENVSCVFTEVYPSTLETARQDGEVLDAAQMRCLCEHLFELDSMAELGQAFAAQTDLSDTEIYQIETEEGWILAKNR